MSDFEEKNTTQEPEEQQYSLNDDRRVKVLSPNALVMKRFFRNKVAVVGMIILIFMFAFSFIGGLISPYKQDQFFYREEAMSREFAVVSENKDYRYVAADASVFNSIIQAQMNLGIQTKSDTFSYRDVTYDLKQEGKEFYGAYLDGKIIGIAYKDVITASKSNDAFPFDFMYSALTAYTNGETSFSVGTDKYVIDEEGGISKGTEDIGYISRYVVRAIMSDIFLSRDFKEKLVAAIENGETNVGTSCWIYANGVYYTLFGECTESGIAGENSQKLDLKTTANRNFTYENFVAWGVRPEPGALIRTQCGHSLIVLGYNEEGITILDGNGNGKGLVAIRVMAWNHQCFRAKYIIQPNQEYYDSLYGAVKA